MGPRTKWPMGLEEGELEWMGRYHTQWRRAIMSSREPKPGHPQSTFKKTTL